VAMTGIETPAWCRWRRGRSAVLVIAPHGGRRGGARRPPGSGRGQKVNDLHTADVAAELADRLDAALIVNPTLDRNELDLNRISQVAARAPWFLVLIEALLDDILRHHARAEVLFVHGWNVMQPKCDIGIGHALADAAAAHLHAAALTVSPGYATDRLGRLQASCASVGFATAFGERYPARHPNNLLQVFRHAAAAPGLPRLAGWTAARRIEAVQLELGVPLRWPGPYRRAFLAAVAAAFDSTDGGQRGLAESHSWLAEPLPGALQFYDPRVEAGLAARVDSAGGRTTGRLLLFLGRRRLALFIGEDARGGRCGADGLHIVPEADGFRLRFDGAALACDDGTLYVDLEQAFAASQLCAARADVRFRSEPGVDDGLATGWIETDGARRPIHTYGFAGHAIPERSSGAWSSQIVLNATFGPAGAVHVRHEFPGAGGVVRERTAAGETVVALPALHVCFDRDRGAPQRILAGDLCCEPLGRMAITRPLAAHRAARVTFGPARFTRGRAEGFGFYEYARAIV
jgi:hypothetical protein